MNHWSVGARARSKACCALGLLASALMGCGSAQEPATPAGEGGIDWAAGAPSASPAYTEEERARLELCPLIGTAVFVAGHSKEQGISFEETERALAEKSPPGELQNMVSMFVKQTYEDDYPDLVEYTRMNNETCVEKLGEITGARADRAEFCLGRHLVGLASYRLKGQHSQRDVSAKLQGVPGYTEEVVKLGYEGQMPPMEGWQECIKG